MKYEPCKNAPVYGHYTDSGALKCEECWQLVGKKNSTSSSVGSSNVPVYQNGSRKLSIDESQPLDYLSDILKSSNSDLSVDAMKGLIGDDRKKYQKNIKSNRLTRDHDLCIEIAEIIYDPEFLKRNRGILFSLNELIDSKYIDFGLEGLGDCIEDGVSLLLKMSGANPDIVVIYLLVSLAIVCPNLDKCPVEPEVIDRAVMKVFIGEIA